MTIGLLNETKIPADSRVAFTPEQCKLLMKQYPQVKILVQTSNHRCYSDAEYKRAGIPVAEELSSCDILFGIKEIPAQHLLSNKTYFFFSHTKKHQPYNREMFRELIRRGNTLIDYECMEHPDGARVLGFGFFAGVVGAHNGMMAYGKRTGAYELGRVFKAKSFNRLIHTYFGLVIPPIKIAVTGSGRVAHGVLEIMNLLGIHEVEPEEYLEKEFTYPVYVHLKGADLYKPLDGGSYSRKDFHANPEKYESHFPRFIPQTDVLMNGIYWSEEIPRLFTKAHLQQDDFRIQTISDITDDKFGSVPCNLGDQTIEDPVYGVVKETMEKSEPYIEGSVDMMAVGNLPNELPRDASKYFGEQLMKHIMPAVIKGDSSDIVMGATMVDNGEIAAAYAYLNDYGKAK